jgi:hypothetical protein
VSSADEQWLERALTGEVPPEAPELEALLARRPDLAERLDTLRELQSGLGRIAAAERAAVAAARADSTLEDRKRLAAARERALLATGTLHAPRPNERLEPAPGSSLGTQRVAPKRAALVALTLAAAAAGLALWSWIGRSPPPRAPDFMGAAPNGVWGELRRSAARHEWTAHPEAESYSVHFFALVDGRRSSEELFSRRVAEAPWLELTRDESASLPDAGYLWEVRAFALGQLLDTALATERAGWRSR